MWQGHKRGAVGASRRVAPAVTETSFEKIAKKGDERRQKRLKTVAVLVAPGTAVLGKGVAVEKGKERGAAAAAAGGEKDVDKGKDGAEVAAPARRNSHLAAPAIAEVASALETELNGAAADDAGSVSLADADDDAGSKAAAGAAKPARRSSLVVSADARARVAAKQAQEEQERVVKEGHVLAAVDPMKTRSHGFAARLRDGHLLGVYSVNYSGDGLRLCSASHDGSVVCWDAQTKENLRTYRGFTGPAYQAAFSPDKRGTFLAVATHDGFVRVFVTRTGDLLLALPCEAPVLTLCWSPNGTKIACGNKDGTAIVWNVADAQSAISASESDTPVELRDFVHAVIGRPPEYPTGHSGPLRRMVWTAANTIVTCSDDRTIRLWDGRTMKFQTALTGHRGAVLDVGTNGEGNKLVTASADGTARVWLSADGWNAAQVLRGHSGVVYAATFTAEGMGRRVITGGHDKCICVWNAGTGQLLQRMRHIHVSFVLGLSCRFDGLQFASASGDHTIGVWKALPPSWTEVVRLAFQGCGRSVGSMYRGKEDLEEL